MLHLKNSWKGSREVFWRIFYFFWKKLFLSILRTNQQNWKRVFFALFTKILFLHWILRASILPPKKNFRNWGEYSKRYQPQKLWSFLISSKIISFWKFQKCQNDLDRGGSAHYHVRSNKKKSEIFYLDFPFQVQCAPDA